MIYKTGGDYCLNNPPSLLRLDGMNTGDTNVFFIPLFFRMKEDIL